MNNKKNKQLILIFEGHDKTGKTTIINELSSVIQIPVFKLKKDKKQFDHAIDLLYGVESTVQFVEQTEHSVIFDRFYLSEYAYSKVYKRATSFEKIFELDTRMSKLNTFIIVCYKNAEEYEVDPLDSDIVKTIDYPKLTREFKNFSTLTKCRTLLLDTSSKNLEKQVNTILNFIEYDKNIRYT